MISAIVFDMDGVIVDTEYLDYQLQSEYILSISKNSTPLTKEDFSSLVGRSGFDLQKRINQLACTNLSSEDFEVAFQQIERHKYHPETVVPIFRKDMVAILEWAKSQDIKLAVASSSPLDAILTVLDSARFVTISTVSPQVSPLRRASLILRSIYIPCRAFP